MTDEKEPAKRSQSQWFGIGLAVAGYYGMVAGIFRLSTPWATVAAGFGIMIIGFWWAFNE